MRNYIFTLLCAVSSFCFAGTHRLTDGNTKRTKRSDTQKPIIENMTNEQLSRLVDHLFEASFVAPDLWEKVMLETAKRNIGKINRSSTTKPSSSANPSGSLLVEKIQPMYVAPIDSSYMHILPANDLYDEWNEDLTHVFKDEFKRDTTYKIELENYEVGCYEMPAWGPLSSPFGWRYNRYHKGVDIQIRKGDTIRNAFDGMVRFAKKKGGYGNAVIVRHFNGLETVYAHLYKINVQEGDVLSSGDIIGLGGSTGHSTGPHLHFEIRFLGMPVDPQYFISFDYGRPLYNTVLLKKNKNGLLAAFHPETEVHVVEKGETLSKIAMQYGLSISSLRQLNHWAPKQYIRLKKGMMVRVKLSDFHESASSK